MKDTRRNSQNQLILAHRGSQTLNDLCMCLAAVLVLLVRLLKGIAETDSVFFFILSFLNGFWGPTLHIGSLCTALYMGRC